MNWFKAFLDKLRSDEPTHLYGVAAQRDRDFLEAEIARVVEIERKNPRCVLHPDNRLRRVSHEAH